MTASFYRAFEDRYRGSRELIKERQEVYLPFIQPLKELYPECPVLDIGCGRGEWLELMIEKGFQARGIDLDEGMLESCHALDLPAEQGEALATLKGLPENSQAVVSGFHIAEHIPFSVLKDIVVEVARVLKPAGLLILETPNAENIVVGTNNFYLDPTHERPIPHLLLNFLTEYSGFSRTKLLRLQENLEEDLASIGLKSVLAGVSQDYAVIAQKSDEAENLTLFEPAFEKEYGVSLDYLAQQYDARINKTIEVLQSRLYERLEDSSVNVESKQYQSEFYRLADDINAKVSKALNDHLALIERRMDSGSAVNELLLKEVKAMSEAQLGEVRFLSNTVKTELSAIYQMKQSFEVAQQNDQIYVQKAESIQQQLNESLSNAHVWYLKANALDDQVKALHASTSWRITAPFRSTVHVSRIVLREPAAGLKHAVLRAKLAVYPWLLRAMRKVASNPRHKQKALQILQRYPQVYARLSSIAYKEGMVGGAANTQANAVAVPPYNPNSFIQGSEPDLSDLSPSAQGYYQRLKLAIQTQHKEPI